MLSVLVLQYTVVKSCHGVYQISVAATQNYCHCVSLGSKYEWVIQEGL